MHLAVIFSVLLSASTVAGCAGNAQQPVIYEHQNGQQSAGNSDSLEVVYFAGGCFWGTEHLFELVNGVTDVESGYANGHTDNPTYQQVSGHNTGYAETVKVTYDPGKLDFGILLDLYFRSIDPTSLNKQGNDIGDQYRTGIYYTTDQQLQAIETKIRAESALHTSPIVVEVKPLQRFYKAEEYHQDYLDKHPNGYCHIDPALFKVAGELNR